MRHALCLAALFAALTALAAADPKDKPKDGGLITVQVLVASIDRIDKQGQMHVFAQVPSRTPTGKPTTKRTKQTYQLADETVIRTNVLPPKEGGTAKKPAKYTAAELKKLKGPNPKLPGYEAKREDLRGGLQVQLELGQTKEDKKAGALALQLKTVVILGDVPAK